MTPPFKQLPILFLFSALFIAESAFAQLERRQVETNNPVELTFLANRNINLYTVVPLAGGELQSSVMHSFGEVSTGIHNFWGLDDGANVRLNVEYGVSDNFSLGITRTRINKVVDLYGRIALIRQTSSGDIPLSISLNSSVGVTTTDYRFLQNNYEFGDRFNFAFSLPIARKFNDNFSFQVSPIIAHFKRVGPELAVADPDVNTYYSVALAARYLLSPRTALSIQYVPPLTDAENLSYNFAIGFDFDTGGHVFQMFFSTSTALNEQYLVSSPNGDFFDREFRFGFNINRVF